MPPSRRIRVPYRRQKTGYHCGPASLSMVLEFFKSRPGKTGSASS